ncbi:hypothetical protein CIB84_005580 [Bambusicola thoracicus]|uniref:Uncharacterized protein n=1 Tax=Bambusicola thoracicus TaxID=9083 RepID=A0A2P4T2S7_BAMTH|nr:hypothetical protein CIB84_005580 [Bambusicola thoracicus]
MAHGFLSVMDVLEDITRTLLENKNKSARDLTDSARSPLEAFPWTCRTEIGRLCAIPKCYFSCCVTALEVQDRAPWQREESTKEEPTEAIMKLLDIAANFVLCSLAASIVTKQW